MDSQYSGHSEPDVRQLVIPQGKISWWCYFLCGVKGVVEDRSVSSPSGMQCLMSGSIPPSAGLSSSSAVVVSAALATVWSNKVDIDREELASLCARAERFVGTQVEVIVEM